MADSNDRASKSRPRAAWLGAASAAVLAFVVYLPSLGNGYTLDDVDAVQRDVRIRDSSPTELARVPYLWNVPAARSPYRPVTTLSYALTWRLSDGRPFAHHLFNVLAHVATTLLLLAVLRRLGAPPLAAGIAASVFAVHPVHVEAVANIVGRADVLMTLFCLICVQLYLARGLPAWLRIVGVCAAYLLAVGSKENGYVLPLLILAAEAFRPESRDLSGRELLRRLLGTWPVHAAFALTLGAYLWLRGSVLGSVIHIDVAAYMAVLPTWLRFTTAVANLTEVARLLLVPFDLSWHYGPAVLLPAGFMSARFWLGVATVTVTGWIAWRGARLGDAGRLVSLGIVWIAAGFVLLSNLIVPMPTWLAERTLYLPSVGLALGVAGTLGLLSAERVALRHPGVLAAAAGVMILFGVRSWTYARVWHSNETLFSDLVERHPESYQAARWAGLRLVDAGELDRGLVWLERAVEQNPNEVLVTLDYARALLLAGRSVEAEERLRPIPRGLHPSVSVFLAQSLIFQERLDEARAVVEEGLGLFPDEPRLLEQRRQLEAG